ncbi:phospholipase [Leifsonia sp. Leaf336]|uniref:phospholipase C n=1 Tax=Leifsonia sp. Leaf336 TaxID=1736341 RepID=UPI0006FBDA92|nr:alkaline phosphatase family protein [Leifsonia sp. Leaf336]KQR51247.1 phospholipase [Leifsonia sp. Leaf336]
MSRLSRLRRHPVASAGLALLGAATLTAAGVLAVAPASAFPDHGGPDHSHQTQTPIKHLVVIFDENISFDHYFGTYPNAANTDGTAFHTAPNTPKANTLVTSGTLTNNPNLYKPSRLTSAQALTCDQNHSYAAEQAAVDGGKMDMFVQKTETDTCSGAFGQPGLVMDYYDGNTVTGLWNYAQNYSMSDNMWDTGFGPSTPGALNLISGQTHGGTAYDPKTGAVLPTSTAVQSPNAAGVGTVIGDPDPVYDDCSDSDHTATSALVGMAGKNVGDLLNARGVTWGWFQGGFTPTTAWNGQSGSYAKCDATTANVGGATPKDYSPHHNPFSYYKSTSNPHHLPPTSTKAIGHTDQANHQYDLTSFDKAVAANNLPAVSFLKAPEAQDGHAGYSDPLDEQKFVVNEINALQKSKDWSSTAVIVTYDDSDGWYDHVAPTVTNGSHDAAVDSTVCTSVSKVAGGYADRCGPSQRLPFLVVSPWAAQNTVDHTAIEQTSPLKFIEDNWGTGRIGDASFDSRAGSLNGLFDWHHPQQREVLLSPTTGAVTQVVPTHGHGGDDQH